MLSYTFLVPSHRNKVIFHYWVLAFVQLLQSVSVWFSAITATEAGYTAQHLAAGQLEPVPCGRPRGEQITNTNTGTSTFHVLTSFSVFFFFCSRLKKMKINPTHYWLSQAIHHKSGFLLLFLSFLQYLYTPSNKVEPWSQWLAMMSQLSVFTKTNYTYITIINLIIIMKNMQLWLWCVK